MHAFSSPFGWLCPSAQRWLCAVLVLVMLGLGWYLKSAQASLKPPLYQGVVELEAPWTSERAREVVESLRHANLVDEARRQTWLDYLFLVVYPLALSLSCALLAQTLDDKSYLVGTAISWGVLLALPADAGENFAMLRMLGGATAAPWPQMATICCSIKFTLAGGGVLFAVVGFATLLVRCLCRAP